MNCASRPSTADVPRAAAPPGRRVYAIGDIHGRLDLLDTLLMRIRADIQNGPAAKNILIFLGDYVDRGPDSRGVIERLSTLGSTDFECVFLKGNHEAMLLDFLDSAQGCPWLVNGGLDTVRAYAGDSPESTAAIDRAMGGAHYADGEGALRDLLRARMPRRHLAFLRALELTHREGDYVFVHAGINPALPLSAQREADLIWIRTPFLDHDGDLGVIVVHGHTTAEQPQIFPHRIGIDTRAWASGVLTAVVLYGERRTFIHT
ncbi:metallophosphoesterase family protein [Varunaivibrio sulfuroxidans]|uniref:Serine/threonine protein phosphatase 1 n=1 Tax=Varunaivibrio sulfuroxidans TaxID=1773489 RepID=A0A4V2UPA1_9PROT|nr:metallophosphoesterase family protein [Varunaivibrio sulfuroxidans]TCS65131.1 serine/threonine protein phosphatase 1 [Varunaivibrio sulfuroxidans]WES29583.1 metallophosphoesterase family protein [Varunaivibrio sulfuroxidans]